MVTFKHLVSLIYTIDFVMSEKRYYKTIIKVNLNYTGEKFPIQFLDPDQAKSTLRDLNLYINNLRKSVKYFGRFPNSTDCNAAVCLFFSKSLLRRTLLDYRSKLQSSHIEHIKQIINDAENIVSHYIYLNAFYDWTDLEFRVSKLFQDDTILVNSISEFNRNRLNPWVLSNEFMNEHIKEIDEGTLPKEKFVEFVQAMSEYFISLEDSDNCMSQVAFNREPYDFTSTQQCLVDDFCELRILSPPSVAYSLSHRLLNIFFRLKIRKCYIKSEEADLREIDKLCAFMYREAVYLARRGFFVRDLFLEHIALCAMMGYEEFHRKHWFTKALSWVNEEGCMKEFRNFEINRTRIMRNKNRFNYQDKSTFLKWRCNVLHSLCDDHPSALLMVVLSHAIRHTVHFMLT